MIGMYVKRRLISLTNCPSDGAGRDDRLPPPVLLYLANNVRKFASERSLLSLELTVSGFEPPVLVSAPPDMLLPESREERSDSARRSKETTVSKFVSLLVLSLPD